MNRNYIYDSAEAESDAQDREFQSTHAVFYFNDDALFGRLGVSTASFPLMGYQQDAEAIVDATVWATNLGAKTIEILSRDEPTDMSGAYTCDACGEVCTCVPDQDALLEALHTAKFCAEIEGQLEEPDLLSLQWLADNLYKLYEGDV